MPSPATIAARLHVAGLLREAERILEEIETVNSSSDCPGRFKCHGPASWCDACGDVDLVCDDPNCEAHARWDERQKARDEAFAELTTANRLQREAQKRYDEAAEVLRRYVTGNPVMVARNR